MEVVAVAGFSICSLGRMYGGCELKLDFVASAAAGHLERFFWRSSKLSSKSLLSLSSSLSSSSELSSELAGCCFVSDY